jgi:uncharacterized repeat protein (TIGR01451 family)
VSAAHDTNPNDNDASATIIVNCPSVQGKTPGFWGNRNGHKVLDPDGNDFINNPITDFPLVGTIGTIALSDMILSNDSCSGVITCTGLNDNLNSNTVEVLMSQTLALSYNILDVAGYSSNTIASLGCNVPPPLNAAPFNLSGSSSVGTVKTIAYGLIAGIYTTTTQDQAGAMNSLLGCLNNETTTLSVTKTGNGPITAGTNAVFTIVVSNANSGGAFGVVLTDTLPTGSWAIGGANAGSCSQAAGVVTCNFGLLFQSATRTITLTHLTVLADSGTNINNTAKVTSTNGGNPQSSATIHVN